MRELLKRSAAAPRVMIPDKLRSYSAACTDLSLQFKHRQHKGLNSRAKNSLLPTRWRERIMKRLKSPRQVQKFLSIHDQVAPASPNDSDALVVVDDNDVASFSRA